MLLVRDSDGKRVYDCDTCPTGRMVSSLCDKPLPMVKEWERITGAVVAGDEPQAMVEWVESWQQAHTDNPEWHRTWNNPDHSSIAIQHKTSDLHTQLYTYAHNARTHGGLGADNPASCPILHITPDSWRWMGKCRSSNDGTRPWGSTVLRDEENRWAQASATIEAENGRALNRSLADMKSQREKDNG